MNPEHLWSCCSKSCRTKFCPECGSQAPTCDDVTAMVAEIVTELKRFMSTADTFNAKADGLKRIIGCLPEECGWSLEESARIIDPYDIQSTIGRMNNMEEQELRDAFAQGLQREIKLQRKMAAAATKNMLKWSRWHGTLLSLIPH